MSETDVKTKTESRPRTSSGQWWAALGVLTVLAVATRLHKVTEPDHVVWDETHFGKFGSWYINRTFFFDVHPPLGKMMIGAFGYMSGYDGAFAFDKPGDKYENVSYQGMRLSCSSMGAALIPLTFMTVWDMTQSLPASTFAAALILADTGMLTLTQYILLDPLLLFFIMSSIASAARFFSLEDRPYSPGWWLFLTLTGISLSAAVATKFVGVFVVAYVGVQVVGQLYRMLGDLTMPLTSILKHFLARALCLILIPSALYVSYYFIHFTVLSKTGNGDGFYSSVFQTTLEGNALHNATIPLVLAYGAVTTIKSAKIGGGYLHSHGLHYPVSEDWPAQQQITTYGHNDQNNKWEIKPAGRDPADWEDGGEAELVRHGDLIRLEHVNTGRNLHSHMEKAPVTAGQYQVSGYGDFGEGDVNDEWIISVVGGSEGDTVRTIADDITLTHKTVGCVMHLSGKQLPAWASEQGEVTCAPNMASDHSSRWNIEGNEHPHVVNGSLDVLAPSFLSKFMESHMVMIRGNSGLKPKEGEVTSQPWEWPINYKGQWFSAIDGYKVYMLGNPVVWWGNLVVMALYFLTTLCTNLADQRGLVVPKPTDRRVINLTACHWLFLGWLLHYVPFFFMGRILYYHHYFPSVLFASMISGILLDYLLALLPSFLPGATTRTVLYHTAAGAILAGLAYAFVLFTPLCYGMLEMGQKPANASFAHLRWLDTWEF